MPYRERPKEDDITVTVVVSGNRPDWVRCSCGRILFYVEQADSTSIVIACPSCKKVRRVVMGVNVDLSALDNE